MPKRPTSRCELTRRGFLAGASSLVTASSLARSAWAGSKLVSTEQGSLGTTLTFHLDNSPYPKGSKYGDPSVIAYVPAYYRLPKNRQVDMMIHLHGHTSTALRAMHGHQLREQVFDSKQNVVLVVPQGPVMATDSSFGQLDGSKGLRDLVRELLREMKRHEVGVKLDKCSVAGNKGRGMLCMSAHSGGYKGIAQCLKHGGTNVNEVYLFDALYGEVDIFRRWVLLRKNKTGRSRHKLISHYAGGKVRENNLALLKALQGSGLKRVHHEKKPGELTRAQLAKGNAIFIGTPLAHGNVAFRHNNLRDCMYASGFKRFVKSDWFEDKNNKRKIDHR